jgi:etoposide-induced 2.4 mRNA
MFIGLLQIIGGSVILFLTGILDSCAIHRLLILLYTSRKLRSILLKTVLLNGVVFLTSILFIDNYLDVFLIYTLPTNTKVSLINTIGEWVKIIIYFMFYILWIYPIYCISAILCMIWNKDVAMETYYIFYPKKESAQSLTMSIAGEIYNILTTAVYLGQIFLLSKIPFVGKFLFIINMSWFYSLSSFDYKWGLSGINIMNRILLCELHWEYMAGFSIIPAIITATLSKYVAIALLAFLTPTFIILAMLAGGENSSFPIEKTSETETICSRKNNSFPIEKTVEMEHSYPKKNVTFSLRPSQIQLHIEKQKSIPEKHSFEVKKPLPIFKIVKVFNTLLLRCCNRMCRVRTINKKE